MANTTCAPAVLDTAVRTNGRAVVLCPTCGRVCDVDVRVGSLTSIPAHTVRTGK